VPYYLTTAKDLRWSYAEEKTRKMAMNELYTLIDLDWLLMAIHIPRTTNDIMNRHGIPLHSSEPNFVGNLQGCLQDIRFSLQALYFSSCNPEAICLAHPLYPTRRPTIISCTAVDQIYVGNLHEVSIGRVNKSTSRLCPKFYIPKPSV
jgi:hypothetical protein